MTGNKKASPSFREHFTQDSIVQMQRILRAGLPWASAEMCGHFIKRAEFKVDCFVATERDAKFRPSAEARRKRLRRMQRALAFLAAEWKAADESEQYVISKAIHRHFNGQPNAQFFFHGNLEVYASALGTAEGWNREVNPTFDTEILIISIAGAWREAFDVDPKKTVDGPFDKMARLLVKVATGKNLHRRNLLRGIDHYHWLQSVIAENEENRNRTNAPMTSTGD